MKRVVLSIPALLTVAAAVAVLGPATPAFAAWEDCLPGQFCLFDTATGEGIFVDPDEPFANPDLSRSGFDDRASAVVNRTGTSNCLYLDADYGGGQSLYIPANLIITLSDEWDDSVSSYRYPGANTSC